MHFPEGGFEEGVAGRRRQIADRVAVHRDSVVVGVGDCRVRGYGNMHPNVDISVVEGAESRNACQTRK